MSIRVTALKTDYADNPLGIDNQAPELSWKLTSVDYAQVQTAYRILVATSEHLLEQDQGDLWDSGQVHTDQSLHVRYGGQELKSRQQCYWKVRVWDRHGEPSAWSDIATWSMGLLEPGDWQAKWIGLAAEEDTELLPSRYLRKEFTLQKQVKRATAYASALGLYMLYLNGERVGDHLFAPGWTDYAKRVQYQTYDVTDLLQRSGALTVGLILGTGWYSGHVGMLGTKRYGDHPHAIMQLEIEYEDGSLERVSTDESWRVTTGPIVYSDMIMGEEYDATEELSGWDAPGYDDSAWSKPDMLERYTGLMTAQVDPPVRVTEQLLPVSVAKSVNGTYIFDMGQNMVGWVRLRVNGKRGQTVVVRYAEMLNPDGTIYTENLRLAKQVNIYTLRGEGLEQLEPHFTFHGFRYVEVDGLDAVPTLSTIVGQVIQSDTPIAVTFETSDAMINKLQRNIWWGQRGNFLSVPTDCPQRNERLGWTGDAQIFVRTACYNADAASFYKKYTIDMIDAQHDNGAFPDVAPEAGYFEYRTTSTRLNWKAPDNAAWGDAGVIIPWTVYQVYGDTAILESSYDAMVRWVEYLRENSDELIRPDYSNYGDWLSINADTPKDVLATAYFAHSTNLLAKSAQVLGKTEEASRYADLYEAIRRAFQKAYVAEDGTIKGLTQTVYVLALQFGLLEEKQKEQAVQHLVNDILAKGVHLTTGFLGVGYLLPALTAHGYTDLAFALLKQESFPSWMYSIRHGATTIWERWDGWTDHNGFQKPSMNSFNHYSLGSVGEWMYRTILGIDTDAEQCGFKHIRVAPYPGGSLRYAKGAYESMYGPVKVSWKIEHRTFKLEVEVPANTTATIVVPGAQAKATGAGAQYVSAASSAELSAAFVAGSGVYHFESTLDPSMYKDYLKEAITDEDGSSDLYGSRAGRTFEAGV